MKTGLRLTGGRWGGRRIAVPKGVRPSSGRLRGALASHWQHRIRGCRFLDLYCGSGAMVLELLGRGGASAVAVDGSRVAVDRLTCLTREWGVANVEIKRGRLPDLLHQMTGAFDLIFADPPYDFTNVEELLGQCARLLGEGGEFAIEVRSDTELPEFTDELKRVWSRVYGDSGLSVYRNRSESE